MALVIDQNSESGFVYGTLIEFIKCWENGANSRLVMETCNGEAWVNLSCCLGRPYENHVIPARRTKSRRKHEKDNLRASNYVKKNVIVREAETQTVENCDIELDDDDLTNDEDCDVLNDANVEQPDDNAVKNVNIPMTPFGPVPHQDHFYPGGG